MSIIGAEDEDFENDLADVSKVQEKLLNLTVSLPLAKVCNSSIFLSLFGCSSQSADDKCPHFDSIDLLKKRPTHLLVFMQHVILQFDPAPLVRT